MKPTSELTDLTEKLIKANHVLDEAERFYAIITAQVYFSESVQARTNAEARQHEVTMRLEADHKKFLDTLYDVRGLVRELRLRREALLTAIKFGSTYEKP